MSKRGLEIFQNFHEIFKYFKVKYFKVKYFIVHLYLQLLKQAIFTTLSLFNLLAVPAPHLLSLFLAANHLLLENHRSLI